MNPFKSKLDARIRAERMHVLVQNQPTSLISTLAVSLFLVYILAPVTSPMYGILWMGAMIALTSIRAVHLRKVKQLEASDYLAQEKWLLYGAFLSGSLFGSSVLVLFPYDNVGLQALLFFLMSSMIAGSVAVYSTHILAFLAYSLPIFLFFFYRAFTLTELFLFLAFIGIFYYVIMVTTMMRVNRSIIKTFNTQFLNHDLANNLSHAKENLEKFNHELFEENQAHLKTQKRLYHLANYDPLTGLANRNMFKESLKDSLKTAQQEHTTMAVLFLDLDNFKIINDTLGHAMGDKLLIGASSRLKSLLNDKSFIARLGGDEFVIIVNEVQESEEISTLAQKIINLLEKPFTFDENEMYIGTSIGISLFPKDGQVAETLIAYADTAMYKAKEKGKNNYQFFNANMYDQMQFRHDIETKLHHAIAKNELRIDYQPKVDVQENRIVGAEALLRWEHTELGEVSPSVFIPIAEESSLINTIGKWVIQKVCEDLAFIREHFDASLSISVNISSSQILHQNLPELIGEHLQRHTLPPNHWSWNSQKTCSSNNPVKVFRCCTNLMPWAFVWPLMTLAQDRKSVV